LCASFLDASALAKRYAPETGTPLLHHLFTNLALDRLYVLNVGIAEVMFLLIRKRNAGLISAAAFTQAVVEFQAETVAAPLLHRIVPDNALVFGALALIERRSVNSTYALVLRSALDGPVDLRSAGDDVVLMASDQRLLRAAQAEGLTTFNPEAESQSDLDVLLRQSSG
jgi:hypothetical protein